MVASKLKRKYDYVLAGALMLLFLLFLMLVQTSFFRVANPLELSETRISRTLNRSGGALLGVLFFVALGCFGSQTSIVVNLGAALFWIVLGIVLYNYGLLIYFSSNV